MNLANLQPFLGATGHVFAAHRIPMAKQTFLGEAYGTEVTDLVGLNDNLFGELIPIHLQRNTVF